MCQIIPILLVQFIKIKLPFLTYFIFIELWILIIELKIMMKHNYKTVFYFKIVYKTIIFLCCTKIITKGH